MGPNQLQKAWATNVIDKHQSKNDIMFHIFFTIIFLVVYYYFDNKQHKSLIPQK